MLPQRGVAVARFDRRDDDVPLETAQSAVDGIIDFDPMPIFANVRVPTLLFSGEDDAWSPIKRLARTGHCPTVGGVDEIQAISPEYERTLVEWLGRVTRWGPRTFVR